jgi:hypothetical protein
MLKCTATWVSVENHVHRGNAGLWKARKTVVLFSALPTNLGNREADFHIPIATTTTTRMIIFPQNPAR